MHGDPIGDGATGETNPPPGPRGPECPKEALQRRLRRAILPAASAGSRALEAHLAFLQVGIHFDRISGQDFAIQQFIASGSWMRRWMARLRGRAPNCGL